MSSKNLPENIIVITDTSCLILLEKIDALHLLPQLFKTILTTPEIAEEYGSKLPVWIIVKQANQSSKEEFLQYVDRGEASAIALALEDPCDYIIIDDMAGRKLATKLGLPVKGTVGVLLLAKQNGVIPLFRPYLNLIQQTNFRLSPYLAEQFIKDAGE
jgi:predicted nucleic acid-binding protein